MKAYCSRCNKDTIGVSRGAQFECKECGHYTIKGKTKTSFKSDGYSAEYVVTSEKRIECVEELEKYLKLDTSIWKIDRWEQQAGSHEGYRKDRKVSWHVNEGFVTSGHVEDSGKMLIVPLHSFSIRVWMSRKTKEIRNNIAEDDFLARAEKYSPKYRKISYKKSHGEHLFELAMPDLQLGRLVIAEEAGEDIDPDKQVREAEKAIDELVGYAPLFNVSRILFPVGNDFFDTNSADMETKHKTPQQDDVRWKRTYKLGCELMVRTIEKLMQVAPVDVLVIPGNHDEDKMWHAGEYLYAWFHKCKDVVVDNKMMKRKYYSFGANLLGLTHGYFEKVDKLDSLMSYHVPRLWATSTYREWHLGDKHHKVDMVKKTEEYPNGVVVRIIRSLASPSVWEFDKGWEGSLRAAEAFIWRESGGVIGQFTAAKPNEKV